MDATEVRVMHRAMLQFTLVVAVGLVLTACGDGGASQAPSAQDGFIAGSDMGAAVDAAQSSTDLPPGASFDPIDLETEGSYEEGYAEIIVDGSAQCEWFLYWLEAFDSADPEAQEMALEGLAALHDSTLFRTADVSFTDLVEGIEEQAALGDPTGIRDFVTLNCRGVTR